MESSLNRPQAAAVQITKRETMTMIHKHPVFARIVLVAVLALAFTATSWAADGNFLYAQTTASQSSSAFPDVPIGGLSITLPAAAKPFNAAVVTLNMPNLSLSGPGTAGVSVLSGLDLKEFAGVAVYNGYTSLTIVVRVPLNSAPLPIVAEWVTNAGATISTQNFASISAILVHEESSQ
jgi:hypothetical protein